MGSVRSLIAYTRSWVSDRNDAHELGRQQLALWVEAIDRAMEFRSRIGEEWFADVVFDALQTDPVGAAAAPYHRIGIQLGEGRTQVAAWAEAHPPKAHGVHEFSLDEFGLDAPEVRRRFANYLERFPRRLEGAGSRRIEFERDQLEGSQLQLHTRAVRHQRGVLPLE